MRFNYDLAQASPVIKDLLVYDGTALEAGEAMEATALTDVNGSGGINSADVAACIDMRINNIRIYK